MTRLMCHLCHELGHTAERGALDDIEREQPGQQQPQARDTADPNASHE